MLALQKIADRPGLDLREVPAPRALDSGEVLIEVIATGICGTDLAIDAWSDSYKKFMAPILPVTLGHETSGRISRLGADVTGWRIGDVVVVNPATACGTCVKCRAGDPVGCLNRQAVGLVRDGAFARYFIAPASYCYRLPESVPAELGALVEPLSVGAHALSVAGFKAGDRVVVFGPGPIGQGAAVLAKEMGARDVAVVGFQDKARFDTLRNLGVDHLFDVSDPAARSALKTFAGEGFDVAIEAAGAPGVINDALGLLKSCGVLGVAGMGEMPDSLDVLLLVKNRLQIRGVSRIPPSVWPEVIRTLAANPAAFAPLISHRLPLAKADAGLALCRSREASKVLLLPG